MRSHDCVAHGLLRVREIYVYTDHRGKPVLQSPERLGFGFDFFHIWRTFSPC